MERKVLLICAGGMSTGILMRKMEKYAEEHTGSEKREARSRLLYLKIALPHTGSTGLIDIFKNADLLLRD